MAQAMADGWISSQGPNVQRFEEAFAAYMGTKYAVACSSGTAALTIALRALGIGSGDEVIVPEATMIASAWAVTYTGAQPVFVDCGNDLNIDINRIEEKITSRTKAIMPVHIYGRPCQMDAIMTLAHDYNLHVVEDACEAHGATFDAKKLGTFSEIGCFSLYANKIITSGEGGVCVTDNKRLYEQLVHLRSMAFEKDHTFLHKKVAYNYRMTNLQASVALAQVERINEFLEKRKVIQGWYDSFLSKFTIPRPEGSVLWMYDILTSMDKRDRAIKTLKEKGIETRMFFKPMSSQPMYRPQLVKDLRAYAFSLKGLYLPTYTTLTKKDVEYISTEVLKLI